MLNTAAVDGGLGVADEVWSNGRVRREGSGRFVAALLAAVGAVGAPVALRVPTWSWSGEVRRNGYELARSLDRLGDVDTFARRALFVAVHLLPAFAALVVVALGFGRRRWAGVAALASAGVSLTVAGVALAAGASTPAWLATLAVGVAALAGGALLLVSVARHDHAGVGTTTHTTEGLERR